jgi:hypothetical protein
VNNFLITGEGLLFGALLAELLEGGPGLLMRSLNAA